MEDLLTTLRQIPDLHGVPDEQLRWLLTRATLWEEPANRIIVHVGDPSEMFIIFLEGSARFYRGPVSAGQEIMTITGPCITGLVPFSRMRSSLGELLTLTPIRCLQLHRDHFRDMVRECFELTEATVHHMLWRARAFTQLDQQTEKMAALGRLSAGLAHELNNPAAAAQRTATTLRERLTLSPKRFRTLLAPHATSAQLESVSELVFTRLQAPPLTCSLLERTHREDELTDWLDDHAIADAQEVVGPLLEAGFTPADLATMEARIGTDALAIALDWLAHNLITEKMARDITEAAGRITGLVGSMKVYTHMDRGEGKETIDLHASLESTVTLLGHKQRTKKATVTLDLPAELPPVPGWPGQLNQVWMNLLDNAIDALPPDGGQLEIRAEPAPDFLLVRVIDNGTGIPDAIRSRIFEPFFTTKPVGQGTGMGLDLVKHIIEQHGGRIDVESVPGHTEFRISLPLTTT